MSARPKRRDLELAVIDAAMKLDAHLHTRLDEEIDPAQAAEEMALHLAVVRYSSYGLAAPSRTRTVLNAPETSEAAGEWMKQFALTDACAVFRQIYFAWRRGDREGPLRPIQGRGLTCDEIEYALGRTHQSMSARVNELKETGWIIDSGVKRPTRSGRKAIVYTPTQAALDLVAFAGLPIPVSRP